ncbi:MAG: M20/M25/M40 family metallo-hydrolase [Propionibacteriaceae bacterium]|nr:M20/M25/M40 family metallo-hydrolase [Propionibacteriaceae bacterium]
MARNAAERLSALVQIETVSAHLESTGIGPFERFIETLRLQYPLLHETLTCERVTDLGLLFHWKGKRQGLRGEPLVLAGHFDVAPVMDKSQWSYPPFSGTITDERVWGRGAFNDKASLVLMCEAVEVLLSRGFTPQRDIYLSFAGDAETTGGASAAIATTLADRGIRPYLVLGVGGAIVEAPLPHVDIRTAAVGVGEKGEMTVQLTCEGNPGKVAAPSRRAPVARLGRAVHRVMVRTFHGRLPKAVPAMLAALAPHATGRYRALYTSLSHAPKATAQFFAVLGGQAAALAHTTVAATMVESGSTSKHLPSSASATLNVHIAIGGTVAGTMALLKRRIGDPRVTLTLVESSEPCAESPIDNPQFSAIREAVEVSYPGVVTAPFVANAATDARHFAAFTQAVYRFSPLELLMDHRPSIHNPDEWVSLDSLVRGQQFFEHLIRHTTG